MKALSSTMQHCGFWTLLLLCSIQFVAIINIIFHKTSYIASPTSVSEPVLSSAVGEKCPEPMGVAMTSISTVNNMQQLSSAAPAGVAVFLSLHAPAWFQHRYTMMVQNVINNIPDNWKVQIFYVRDGASKYGLDISPGIKRHVESGKVVLTVIDREVFKTKRKKFELMVEPWIWEHMLADTVLTFGGTSVICSNSPLSVANFTRFDYIGAPWHSHKGVGGDGSISIRNRTTMLAVIKYELDKIEDETMRKTAYKSWGQEDQFFVSRLLQMQKEGIKVSLASKEQTMIFGGSNDIFNNDVWAVSGTLPGITWQERHNFISACPEMKMHWIALHEPACFGATSSINSTICAATICALRPQKERKGGC